jgi:hypothetical protein
MKATKLFTLLVGGSLLLSASAFAGNSNKKTLHLYESVTVEGQQLAPGDYRLEWSGTGPDVKLNILKGKDTVATVSAHIVPVDVAFKQDGYSASTGKGGSPSVTEIFFSGDKFDLELGDASSAKTPPATTTSGTN